MRRRETDPYGDKTAYVVESGCAGLWWKDRRSRAHSSFADAHKQKNAIEEEEAECYDPEYAPMKLEFRVWLYRRVED